MKMTQKPRSYVEEYRKWKDVENKEWASQEQKYTMDVREVPYKVPAVYSLESEMDTLILLKKKINIISDYICKTDVESIMSDWKRIGGVLWQHQVFLLM